MNDEFAKRDDLFEEANVSEVIDAIVSTVRPAVDEGRTELRMAEMTSAPAESELPHPLRAPDVEYCVYDARERVFIVFYVDGSQALLREDRLELADEAQVIGCRVDEFHRGVIVDFLTAGKRRSGFVVNATDFSGDVALYDSDPEFRERVDRAANLRAKGRPNAGELFASKVKQAREALGWTAAELARRAGIAPPNIHRIESGKHAPSSKTAFLMAEILRRPVGWFYDADS